MAKTKQSNKSKAEKWQTTEYFIFPAGMTEREKDSFLLKLDDVIWEVCDAYDVEILEDG